MDERAINGAAIEAINDLQLDCEIKDVCKSPGGDEWCIQFSGKYGHFCDDFKNQFGKENSSEVIREKIKGYLIKQVNKLRSTTGRRRKPATTDTSENRAPESSLLAAPLKLVEELFDRAASIAGGVVGQASNVVEQASTFAETARDVVADAAANISPVTIEVRSTSTRSVEKRASRPAKMKAAKATKAAPAKAKKAAKRVTRQAGKPAKKVAKKTGKAARKIVGQAKKSKASKKSSRRGK
jgi:hypothetical protein